MIQEYTIKSFEDIYHMGFLLRGWIYRGQSQDWPLATKAERISDLYDIMNPADIEWIAMKNFQGEAQNYGSHTPPMESTVDWLSFLQNYGGPTRLLDFTTSIYIALFFAIENSAEDAVIWAFNEQIIFHNLRNKYKLPEWFNYKDSQDLINSRDRHNVIFELLPVKPSWMSDRQSIQQGVFLYPVNMISHAKGSNNPEGKRYNTFQDNLLAELGISVEELQSPTHKYSIDRLVRPVKSIEKLITPNSYLVEMAMKFIIPQGIDLRIHLMAELNKMNVNSRTLFPGLDGLARSYNFSFDAYDMARTYGKPYIPKFIKEILVRKNEEIQKSKKKP